MCSFPVFNQCEACWAAAPWRWCCFLIHNSCSAPRAGLMQMPFVNQLKWSSFLFCFLSLSLTGFFSGLFSALSSSCSPHHRFQTEMKTQRVQWWRQLWQHRPPVCLQRGHALLCYSVTQTGQRPEGISEGCIGFNLFSVMYEVKAWPKAMCWCCHTQRTEI